MGEETERKKYSKIRDEIERIPLRFKEGQLTQFLKMNFSDRIFRRMKKRNN